MGENLSPARVDRARAMAALQADGWTIDEIAKLAQLAPGTVRNILHQLRKLDPTVPYRRRPNPPEDKYLAAVTSAARNPRIARRNAHWAMRHDMGETIPQIAATDGHPVNTVAYAVTAHRKARRHLQGINQ